MGLMIFIRGKGTPLILYILHGDGKRDKHWAYYISVSNGHLKWGFCCIVDLKLVSSILSTETEFDIFGL